MKDVSEYADAHLRIFDRPRPESRDDVTSVFLIGICGTGMGSLAGLLRDAGLKVSGSDAAAYPPMSTRLAAMQIPVTEGFSPSNLDPAPDLTVVGNACTPGHVEATFAREQGLIQMSLPEAISYFFLASRKPIVVAGTHGKTTTTGLVTHVESELGNDPGYLVGGVLKPQDSSYAIGSGEYFVIEGDEYDSAYFDKRPKFMHYMPHIAVVTSLEYDHVDIYDDFDDYVAAFERFARIIDKDGWLILNADDENVLNLAGHTDAEVLTYGLDSEADVMASNIHSVDSGQKYELIFRGKNLGEFSLPLNGRHNLLNSLAAIAVGYASNGQVSESAAALSGFQGLKRRQEVLYDSSELVVIDDFAHHPTAVRETIAAIRQKYSDRQIVAVFEPRSNSSRRKVFERPYIDAFAEADRVIISSPPFRHNDNRDDFMDTDIVVDAITSRGTMANAFGEFDDLFSYLTANLSDGDVVLIMSNGGFHGIHSRLIDYQKAQHELP